MSKKELLEDVLKITEELQSLGGNYEDNKVYQEAMRLQTHTNTYFKKWNIAKFEGLREELNVMITKEKEEIKKQEEIKRQEEEAVKMKETTSIDTLETESKEYDEDNPGYLAAKNRTGKKAKTAIEIGLDLIALGVYIVDDGRLFRSGKEIGRVHKATGTIYYDIQDFEIIGHKFMYAYYYGEQNLNTDLIITHIDGDKQNNRPGNIVQIPRKGAKKLTAQLKAGDRVALEELRNYNPEGVYHDVKNYYFESLVKK